MENKDKDQPKLINLMLDYLKGAMQKNYFQSMDMMPIYKPKQVGLKIIENLKLKQKKSVLLDHIRFFTGCGGLHFFINNFRLCNKIGNNISNLL